MTDIKIRVEKLLDDVGKEVEKSNEIARLKGENFSLFKILDIERRENKTHSNFLVALLNPKAEHGLGNVFLKLFCEMIFSEESRIPLTDEKRKIAGEIMQDSTIEVKTEMHLGKVNYDEMQGGRVDISIQGNNGKIFIENKIDAGDQKLQIARYVKNPKAVVFYLTLFGDEPSKASSGKYKVNEHFFLLSYKTEITNWLIKCQNEASDYPIIRETIKQYLILIKKLTGQLSTQEMEEKIISILFKDESSFKAAKTINNILEGATDKICDKIIRKLKDSLFLDGDKLEIYTAKKEPRWKHSFFIKVLELPESGSKDKYDIGINVELRNPTELENPNNAEPIFYFCVTDQNKNRNDGDIKKFEDLKDYLVKNLNKSKINRGKNSHLAKLFYFEEITFNLLISEYFKNDGRLIQLLQEQLIHHIEASKLSDYKAK